MGRDMPRKEETLQRIPLWAERCPGKRKLMTQILIVDDDVYIGNMIEEMLEKRQYRVLRAYSGTEALMILSRTRPDLILLDLMLPGMSGEEVLTHIKGIPVIVISGKSGVDDKVGLLLGGAVDYMTKPFHLKELEARIQVHLRDGITEPEPDTRLVFDDLVLDTETCTVSVKDRQVGLTRTEYAILKQLMQNPRRVITKIQLLDNLFEDTPDCTEDSLRVHISHLRSKLRKVSGKDYVESVWGIGFKMSGNISG